ncbi:hypothetical protein CVT26_012224 [Gymnopilus dilepis]|uniref:Uncharacterized protein n=1 Tax=Gymnopilus dilepis TaxID=231916 RepID=A0A409YQ59_9AGAR|nr:hypothetical protein CVT26_012224 [Gymnopilus dilepis]
MQMIAVPSPGSSHQAQGRPANSSQVHSSSRRPTVKLRDIGILAPGQLHRLPLPPQKSPSAPIIPTPQSILDGSYAASVELAKKRATDSNVDTITVIYAPRTLKYTGEPTMSIVFSYDGGRPGPTLFDLLKRKVVVDHGEDKPFKETSWIRTSVTLDVSIPVLLPKCEKAHVMSDTSKWPGMMPNSEYFYCGPESKFRTRQEIAFEIAAMIAQLLREVKSGKRARWVPISGEGSPADWNVKKTSSREVRLIALNYYKKTWVPVLAKDAASADQAASSSSQ